jgi:L-iditol 2-dehydrogenase
VALEPALYCYHCEFCHSGRHNICRNIQFQSSGGIPGFFRQYVSLPAGNLLPLPSGLSLEEATLFEPLAVVLHSMKFVQLQPGETAAVFGAGPIGLLTVVLLKLAGARRVWSVEPVAQRRELARQCGADGVLDPHEVNSAVEILRATGGRGVDVVVDCATRERSLDGAVESVRNGGRLVITGIPHDLETPFNWHAARRKELAIYNVRRSNHESEAALRLLADHVPVFGKLVTHRFALGDIQRAFDLLRDYSDGAGKVIVTAEG